MIRKANDAPTTGNSAETFEAFVARLTSDNHALLIRRAIERHQEISRLRDELNIDDFEA